MPHFLSDLLGVIKPKGLKVWALLCSTYGNKEEKAFLFFSSSSEAISNNKRPAQQFVFNPSVHNWPRDPGDQVGGGGGGTNGYNGVKVKKHIR